MKHTYKSISKGLNKGYLLATLFAGFAFTGLHAQSQISDADGDTKVQTEKSNDEDMIRFDLGGTERWIMRGAGLEPSNSGRSVFIGEEAGASDDMSENQNVFIGYQAGNKNISGDFNVFLGRLAGYYNTNGTHNVFTGYAAGYKNVDGHHNTFTGVQAGYHNKGDYNAFFGHDAGRYNDDGHHNTFSGVQAGYGNTTGAYNDFSGYASGHSNTTGHHNTLSGVQAGYSNTIGFYNTFLGHLAGYNNTTGSYNTAMGYKAGMNGTGWMNRTAIGYNAQNTASNQVRVGTFTVNSIGGFANWTNISDSRMKKEVKESTLGLEFIMNLRPVTYQLDIDAIAAHLKTPEELRVSESEDLKESMLQTGFIAQEVEKAAKDLGIEFSGVDVPKNDQDLYGLRYAEFVVPLVKGMQEQQGQISGQQQIINEQSKEIEAQKELINHLMSRLDQIEQVIGNKENNENGSSFAGEPGISGGAGARLFQNTPNPFDRTTTITYDLDAPGSVRLAIYNEMGMPVEVLVDTYQEKGKHSVRWDATDHMEGVYIYQLTQNEKVLSRRMMLIK